MLRHLLAVSWRADRAATALVIGLSAGVALATSGLAVAQRDVVNSLKSPGSGHGGLILAVVIGAASQMLWIMGSRLRNTFRSGLVSKVDVELAEEVIGDVGRVPGIEHLERSDYLDKVFLAVKGTYTLAGYVPQLVDVATTAAGFAVSVWVLMTVDPRLLLLTAAALVPLLLGNRAQRAVRRANEEVAAASRLELHLHNLCLDPAAAKEIRISSSGAELGRRAEQEWDAITATYRKARMRGAGLSVLGWSCYAAGFAAALVLAARQIVDGAAGVGALVLVVSIAGQLRAQLGLLQEGWGKAADAGEVAGHFRWLKRYAAERQTGHAPVPATLAQGLTLDRVGFAYPGGEAVLHDISMRIAPGTVVGLVGANGAGKTTLVKLITGLHSPSEGSIRVDGTDLTDLAAAEWAAATCGSFQDFAKFEFLVRESVGVGDLPRIDDREAVQAALTNAGADSVVDSLPDGLDSQLGTVFEGSDLSHGQWQRVALARGLMRTAPLLLVLDEPTAALDPQAEHDLFAVFARQAKAAAEKTGAITFLISHRFSTVDMADRIFVIEHGSITESGSHAELLAARGRYAQLYATQAAAYE
jgi:ATP-binding cassette subfamily B protein